jgi:hypothetical protein
MASLEGWRAAVLLSVDMANRAMSEEIYATVDYRSKPVMTGH